MSYQYEDEEENPLLSHFNSYCASFLKDINPTYKECNITPSPLINSRYYNQEIQNTVEILRDSIFRREEETSIEDYIAAIKEHRDQIIFALTEMVEDYFYLFGDMREIILFEKWDYFKFSRCKGAVFTFKEDIPTRTVTVIPRYLRCGVSQDNPSYDGEIILDVDELLTIKDMSWDLQKKFMEKKKENPFTKILTPEGNPTPLREINTPFTVGDWKLIGIPL